MRIVIVGGVAAGMSAAARARRQNKDADVVVFERGEFISYGACGLPYVIGEKVRSFEALIVRTPEQMREQGVDVRTGHAVLDVEARAQTVTVRRPNGESVTEPYDRLLLATGALPASPPWEGLNWSGVHVLRNIPDGRAIEASVQGARQACIIGGGYIGIELAEAFRERGLNVVMLERLPEVAGHMLDAPYQQRVREALEQGGVDVRTGVTVQGLRGHDGRVTGVQTDQGDVEADLVVVAVGVRANTHLARAAGVELGETGAVAVNERQETSVEGIYAAGDNTESLHLVSGHRVHVPLALAANRMGRVAGVNMAGGSANFPGIVGTGIFKAFDLGVARTGLTQDEAERLGLRAVSVDLTSHERSHYYRGVQDIHVRLTAEKGSGRLLGAQLASEHTAAVKRVDVVAALLPQRATVQDLFEADLAYAPPFSTTWDVLLAAADKLGQVLARP